MQKQSHEHGYFLLITLIMVHILSFIGLQLWSQLNDEIFSLKDRWLSKIEDIQAMFIMQTIEKGLTKLDKKCMVPAESSESMKQHSHLWWEKRCRHAIHQHIYWYAIEKVKHDPCASSITQNVVTLGTTYYRINVLKHRSALIVQAITAVAEHQIACQGEVYQRKIGRHSWREL